VATGAAFRTRYLREVMKDDKYDQVSVAFFGDGTANNGAFYECLNMASLYKLPVIFVVENNLWAIGMNHWRATAPSMGDAKPHIYKKGEPFGMPGVLVDGMDVLKVREVALEAVARARRGDGPTVIEAETYRFRGHSLADPDELRSKEEKEYFAAKDPIPALEKHLLSAKLATAEELAALRKKVDAVVEEAVEFADASPSPQRKQLLENVFPDAKGFGIAMNGKYHYEDPLFSEGTANV
jgi:pyruvate dehydrogenase E1 component alpha subunit